MIKVDRSGERITLVDSWGEVVAGSIFVVLMILMTVFRHPLTRLQSEMLRDRGGKIDLAASKRLTPKLALRAGIFGILLGLVIVFSGLWKMFSH